MTPLPRPPALVRAMAALCLRGDVREAVLGDLDEAFHAALAAGVPVGRARWRYRRHAVASILTAGAQRRSTVSSKGAVMSESSTRSWLRGLPADLRYVARTLAASPGYVAIAVLSLAIGIGANVAMFTVVRAIVFHELAVARPDELRWVTWNKPHSAARRTMNYNDSGNNFSYPDYQALVRAASGRIEMLGFNFAPRLTLSTPGQPATLVNGALASGTYFSTLGLGVTRGRPLDATDDSPNAPPVCVISDALWQRLFGRDPDAIGRTVSINHVAFEIVGVTPAGFHGLSIGGFFPATDLTAPIAQQPVLTPQWAGPMPLAQDADRYWLRAIVRVRPGVETAPIENAFAAAVQAVEPPAGPGESVAAVKVALAPASRGVDSFVVAAEQPLRVLSIVSAFVLLIACTNLAGIMLARGVARQRDVAVRRALGASRALLVRQWVLESLVLAAAGGLAGILVAIWSGPVIARMLTTGLGAIAFDFDLDWRLVGAGFAVTAFTAILCSALPAWRLTRSAAFGDLRTRVVGGHSPKLTAGRVLIAAQIAISVPLLVGALLFLRTLHNLGGIALGFDPTRLVMLEVNVPKAPTPPGAPPSAATPEQVRRMHAIVDRLAAAPGVRSATILETVPASGVTSNTNVMIGGQKVSLYMDAVGPGYFETMRSPIVAGREFGWHDDASAPGVAILSRAAAERFFPKQSPIDQTFQIGMFPSGWRTVTIVGVAENAIGGKLKGEPPPIFYDPWLQRPGATYQTRLAVRTTVDPATLVPQLKAAIAAADPGTPVSSIETQEEQLQAATSKERVFSRMLTLFGAFALLLTCIGLHGLTSYAVARRTSEIGIRLALGAQRSQVLWLMLRQVVVLAAAGLVIGVPVTLAAARYVASLLYGVEAKDTWTIAGAATLMLVVAIAAGWWPARRAAHMEALSALRQE